MRNFNKLMVQGALGGDPSMRYVPSGQSVTNFSVAVNDDYKDKDGNVVKQTMWLKAVVWGKLGEEVANKYLKKGSKVILVGKLSFGEDGGPKTWEAKDGSHKASFEMTVSEIYMIGGGEKAESGPDLDKPPVVEETDDSDSLPF
jgi:single-strand DNA-binding protein